MRIDIHSHFYPEGYLPILRRAGYAEGNSVGDAPIVPWEGVEARLRAMSEAQVDVEVISVSTPSVYFPDPGLSRELAALCNEETAALCAAYPDRFRGLLSVPLPDVAASLEEIHRFLGRPGVVGVLLGTHIDGMPLDAPQLRPFFEELNRLRLPVLLHPMAHPCMPPGTAFRSLGFLFETCIAATRLVLSGIREEYPHFPLILSHLGGALPFISYRMDSAARRHYQQVGAEGKRPPKEYYRAMYFDTAQTAGDIPFQCTYRYVGADRILLGTDFPFTPADHMNVVPAVEAAAFLSREEKEKIGWQNAAGLIGLRNS